MPPNYTEFCSFGGNRVHLHVDVLGEIHQWELNWAQKCHLMGGYQMYVLQGRSSLYVWHPPILALQEQLALRGLRLRSLSTGLGWNMCARLAKVLPSLMIYQLWPYLFKSGASVLVHAIGRILARRPAGGNGDGSQCVIDAGEKSVKWS